MKIKCRLPGQSLWQGKQSKLLGCKRKCDDDVLCKFFYYNNKLYCITYASCDKTVDATNIGSIYRRGNFNARKIKYNSIQYN